MDKMEHFTIVGIITQAELAKNKSGVFHNIEEQYTLPPWFKGVLLLLYSIFMAISIGGNIVVCLLHLRSRQLRTVANYFVVNLAFSDIIMAILCVPFTILSDLIYGHWVFGAFLCKAVGYLQLSCVTRRAFVLVAAAADRHRAVWKPTNKRMSKKDAMALMCVIWIISFLIPLPIAVYSQLVTVVSGQLCVEIWSSTNSKISYGIAMTVITFALPLGVLFFTYAHIVSILGRETPGEYVETNNRHRLKAKTKTIKTMSYVVAWYLVCILPTNLITIIGDFDPTIYTSKTVNMLGLFFNFLAVSNSASWPILFFTTDTVYRKAFWKLFRKSSNQNHKTDISMGPFAKVKKGRFRNRQHVPSRGGSAGKTDLVKSRSHVRLVSTGGNSVITSV